MGKKRGVFIHPSSSFLSDGGGGGVVAAQSLLQQGSLAGGRKVQEGVDEQQQQQSEQQREAPVRGEYGLVAASLQERLVRHDPRTQPHPATNADTVQVT